jgi:hypothetical protein
MEVIKTGPNQHEIVTNSNCTVSFQQRRKERLEHSMQTSWKDITVSKLIVTSEVSENFINKFIMTMYIF